MRKIQKILVVEDDMIIQMFITKVLKNAGFEIVGEARDGDEAIRLAGHYQPDLVLMDIGIVGSIDGVETGRIIRDEYRIPVLFITGNSDKPTMERAEDIDPIGFIFKPIDENHLKNKLLDLNNAKK